MAPIHDAAIKGNDKEVRHQIEKVKVNPNLKGEIGWTPLQFASTNGHVAVTIYLVDHGAELDLPNGEGLTALYYAAEKGFTAVAKYLVDAGAFLDNRDKKTGKTTVNTASQHGHYDVVKYLVDNGADFEMPDNDGYTPVHNAATYGHDDIVEYLMDMGADPSIRNRWGESALYSASLNGHFNVVDYLVDHNSDLEAKDKDGETPFFAACKSGHADVVWCLANAGADVHVTTKTGKTAMKAAKEKKHTEVIELIQEITTPPDTPGLTPLLSRQFSKKQDIVKSSRRSSRMENASGKSPTNASARSRRSSVTEPRKTSIQQLRKASKMSNMSNEEYKDHIVESPSGDAAAPGFRGVIAVCDAENQDPTPALAAPMADADLEEFKVSDEEIQNVMFQGETEWMRAKIMVLGEGRAGKSALTNTFVGRAFHETDSTVGINQLHVDVKFATIGGRVDKWTEAQKSLKEYEAAVAKEIVENRERPKEFVDKMEIVQEDSDRDAGPSGNNVDAAAERHSVAEIQQMTSSSSQKRVTVNASADEHADKADVQSSSNDSVDGQGAAVGKAENGGLNSSLSRQTSTSAKSGTMSRGIKRTTESSDSLMSGSYMDRDPDVIHRENSLSLTSIATRMKNKTLPRIAVKRKEVDNELVMKCVAQAIEAGKLKISIFDYGGQSVFNVIHHLFLTRYGVYLLVFNMEWLVSDDQELRGRCLSYLTFWLNSVVMHTLTKDSGIPPILLVGTRKDKVRSPGDHQKISKILIDTFQTSAAWPFILENSEGEGTNGRTTLSFFPVDNTKGLKDATVAYMMKVIERAILESSYVKAKVPLAWLQALDQLTNQKRVALNMENVMTVAQEYGIDASGVPVMLAFLHEMGVLMWHNDLSLRDVVIMDAVAYFVGPATRVICKHTASSDDDTRHVLDIHKRCQKEYFNDWKRMVSQGVVSENLLRALLEKGEEEMDIIIHMMVKFGLLVRLRSDDDDERLQLLFGEDRRVAQLGKASPKTRKERFMARYLVPALLPADPEYADGTDLLENFLSVDDWTDGPIHTCYFVFSMSSEMRESVLSIDDLRANGFLPRGLFERYIGRVVAWSQQTNPNGLSLNNTPLYHSSAVLMFGLRCFRLSLCLELHSIRVDVQGSDPQVVFDRLEEQLIKVMAECMHSLQVFIALPYPLLPKGPRGSALSSPIQQHGDSKLDSSNSSQIGSPDGSVGRASTKSGGGRVGGARTSRRGSLTAAMRPTVTAFQRPALSSVTLVPLELLRNAASHHMSLSRPGGRKLLGNEEIRKTFAIWLPAESTLQDTYDVFLSYRWNEYDSAFTLGLFDIFSYLTIGTDKRSPTVFLDRMRLENGRNFKSDFVQSLSQSTLIIPILSCEALERMLSHDPRQEDNLLIEWICALECSKQHKHNPQLGTRVERIYPVMFGKRTVEGAMRDLFQSGYLTKLPHVVPTASLRRAAKLLHKIGVLKLPAEGHELSENIHQYTVNEVVQEIVAFQGFAAWNTKFSDVSDGAMLESAREIMNLLRAVTMKSVQTAISAFTKKAMMGSGNRAKEDSNAGSPRAGGSSGGGSSSEATPFDSSRVRENGITSAEAHSHSRPLDLPLIDTSSSNQAKVPDALLSARQHESLKEWMVGKGIALAAAQKYSKLLIDGNIAAPKRLARMYRDNKNLLTDLGIDKYDAEDIVAGIEEDFP